MPESVIFIEVEQDVEHAGDTAIVRCRGKMVAGVLELVYTEVSQLIPKTKRIVLDLSDVTQMDSMGLGTVVRLYVSAKGSGCELALMNLGPRIRELLGITHLLSVIRVIGEQGVTVI